MVSRLHIGDDLSIEVKRATGILRTVVVISGYQQPVVQIEQIPGATVRQQELQRKWMAGKSMTQIGMEAFTMVKKMPMHYLFLKINITDLKSKHQRI